jgi:hypothetical protein
MMQHTPANRCLHTCRLPNHYVSLPLPPATWSAYPRSFQGFTCLMQLSSRTKDWVVDCLALRNQLGPALAPIFADPSVVKVGPCLLLLCGCAVRRKNAATCGG